MKIGLMVARLEPGGAERQLMRLAVGLARQGHRVEVLCYRGASAYDAELAAGGVVVRTAESRGRLEHVALTRRWFETFTPDVVHAFMKRASGVAVLARRSHIPCRILASDFSTATYGRRKPSLWAALCLFGLADGVVTETDRNRRSLERLAPWLRGRVAVVRNGLELARFQPPATPPPMSPLRFCVVGSVYEVKNPERVVEAVGHLYRRRGDVFRLDWYGRLGLQGDGHPAAAYHRARALSERLGVERLVTFHGEIREVEHCYQGAHALIHASLQEGFPNAVAEGMACGLPLLVGQVSDLPLIVRHADNGIIFDETDPESIAEAMERMLDCPAVLRESMGHRSRQLAIDWFGEARFIEDYLGLYTRLLGGIDDGR
ncbi:glycosyltransferase family 4 protein [Modicisalibacter tunisiensis]|uniref:glycosyltransferase family 4 protein n=1 Tax=Modicisalibacter tunisiensis TaxID=390637 RepID=UPI001CC9F5C4|nr:glycosyltransferase family 4 protein [Modicisalibacter tunisiensis]MBZ9538050.1 glycosyltransferase family 4 protein [Modicisalibacter tunisiensis]